MNKSVGIPSLNRINADTVSFKGLHEDRALFNAINSGDIEECEYWLDKGANIEGEYAYYEKGSKESCEELTPLIFAIKKNDAKIAQMFLDKGANPNHFLAYNYYGGTPYPITISQPSISNTFYPTRGGGGFNFSPLLETIKQDNVEIAKMLLDKGARALTPERNAARYVKSLEMAETLGRMLDEDERCGHRTAIELLVERIAHTENKEEETELYKIIRYMLDRGYEVEYKSDAYHTSAITYAKNRGLNKLADILELYSKDKKEKLWQELTQ